jgi:small conductance mechanosensitive channel
MNELWQQVEPHLHTAVGQLLAVVLIALVGWLFYRYFIHSLQRIFVRLGASAGVMSFLFNTIRALLLCAVVLAVLRQFGVETTSLVALLGAGGAALLLSLQGFMGNFAAGLVLLGERMVRLGDTIEVGDVRGSVVEMQTLHVIVETAERIRVSIPNSMLISTPLRNHSALPMRRVQWLLPVGADLELNSLKDALITALLADSRILRTPAPVVFVRDWSVDKQTLAVQAWTAARDAQDVQDQLLEPLGKVVLSRIHPPATESH